MEKKSHVVHRTLHVLMFPVFLVKYMEGRGWVRWHKQ